MTQRGEPLKYLHEVVFAYDNASDCLPWPYARSEGYGQVWICGVKTWVHRLMCERQNGPAPSPRHDAAHLCGKGHEGCVNGRHLKWKTRKGNHADKLEHGTHNRGENHNLVKVTEAAVREMRAFNGVLRVMAEKHVVSRTTVCDIRHRRTWWWLED